MPAKSQAQYRYMQALAHGSIKNSSGMTREEAKEYVQGNTGKLAYKNLTPKLRKMMRGGKV